MGPGHSGNKHSFRLSPLASFCGTGPNSTSDLCKVTSRSASRTH